MTYKFLDKDNKQIQNLELYIPLNLSFFNEGGEKTEQPTARKRRKAREEGQVAKSQELNTAILFLAAFFGLRLFAGYMFERISSLFQFNLVRVGYVETTFERVHLAGYIAHLFAQVLIIIMPLMAISMTVGIITNLVQVGWHPTSKPLKPKFSKINPLKGFKRIFSMRTIVELVKSLAKMGVIGAVIYFTISGEINRIPQMSDMGILPAIIFLGTMATQMGINVGLMFLVIAVADIFYQRMKHTKDLKMTKQEVKEEHKNIEGNPETKRRIRQKMREMSMRRMMQEMPKADVVITNPTHYAVALKYDKEVSDAPYVIAKGVDFLAKRIKDAALEYDVEIVENPQLARALYASVNVGSVIPSELYQAVAEILAFVYKLKNREDSI
ncbi:MAG: flagellar biosynthesis protein FlhB [Defluviitaleaceae bacterium]|nr:flagellar biosynthesis protein FlhB [Defluviitaleaceae bacterium]